MPPLKFLGKMYHVKNILLSFTFSASQCQGHWPYKSQNKLKYETLNVKITLKIYFDLTTGYSELFNKR